MSIATVGMKRVAAGMKRAFLGVRPARRLIPVLVLLAAALPSWTEVPVRTEELVWSMLAFNGRDYTATFATERSDAIYLLAGVDNFLSLRKTLVYWWPLTSDWKTDTDSLNVQFPGSLELRDARGRVREIALQSYTYFNVRGDYEVNWKVRTGKAAEEEIARYNALYDSYFKAMRDYQRDTAAYEDELRSLATRIQKLKDGHGDYAALLQRLDTLPAPATPARPDYYVVPPAQMQQAFILNLPVGRYTIRLVSPDGTVAEGSERAVVVHARGRTGGVGFEIIPGDKWTRPEASVTPSSTIYASGAADLYLRPFFEDEYNDLFYARTIDNAARGNPSIVRWVRVQQVPRAGIVVRRPGRGSETLSEKPFLVEQSQGNTLGYTISPWDPNGSGRDKQPNLVAFPVPLRDGVKRLSINAVDAGGRPLAGSEREIRVVRPLEKRGALIALALSPLLLMAVVLVVRSRAYAGKQP
ncbi:MAG TPA: hypothetical protein VHE79_00110 [Spirochaetia bacterium]